MRLLPWQLFIAGGVITAMAWLAVAGTLVGDVLYTLAAVAAIGACAVAARRHPTLAPAWWLMGLGVSLLLAGDLVDSSYRWISGAVPLPSWADLLYLAAYPVLGFGLTVLLGRGRKERNRAAPIDAAMIAVAAAMLAWLFLINPYAANPTLELSAKLVAFAYPIADLALLAIMVHMILAVGLRSGGKRLLGVAVGTLLAADVLFAAERIAGTYTLESPAVVLWLLSYVAFGAAALHPSPVAPERLPTVSPTQLSAGRFVTLLLAALVGPTLVASSVAVGNPRDAAIIGGATGLIFLLAIARVVGLALELEQTSERSQTNEARLELALEAARMAAWDWDAASGSTFRSPGMPQLFGIPVDSAPDERAGYLALIHPDDRALLDASDRQRVERGGRYEVEYRIVRPDGEQRWLRDRAEVVLDDAGRPVRIRGITQDVTDRKHIEEALHAERDLLSGLLTTLPDAVYIKDTKSRFLRLNQATADQLGVATPDAAVGKTDADFWPPSQAAAFLTAEQGLLERGEPQLGSLHQHGSGPTARWIMNNKVPLRDAAGQTIGLVGINHDLTEQRQVDAALRQSEARQRALLDAFPDLVFRLDRDGTFLDYKAERLETLTVSPDDLLGKWVGDVLPATVAKSILTAIDRVLATGEMQTIEYQLDAPTANTAYEARIVASGPDEIVVVVRDVTRQRQSEAALREAESRYRSLVEHLPGVVYVDSVAALGNLQYVSPQITALLGIDPAEWLADPDVWSRQIHPEDRAWVLAGIARSTEKRRPLQIEYRFLHIDGRIVWVRDEAVLIESEDATPLYWQGFLLDITEQRQGETNLRESEARFRTLVEHLPAVVSINDVGPLTPTRYISPYAETLLGYTPEELLTDPEGWIDHVHPDDRARVLAEIARTNASGETFTMEYRRYARDGRLLWLRDTSFLIHDEEGKPRFWQIVSFDITDRKRGEEDLRAAKEAAEEASRLKSSFLSTMSHELRTPMNAILGYAHLLLDGMAGELTGQQQSDVRRIADGADRLLALINDVLDLSRIEAGSMELALEFIDLRQIVTTVRDEILPMAREKGIDFILDLPSHPLTVRADPLRLHQVLLNLVGNAVKFTKQGQVEVCTAATAEQIELAVTDTGIGIPAAFLPHLFDEFRQADASTTRRFGGSGLGLAIAKRLLDLQGGTIDVQSTEDVGSTFTIRLPAVRDEGEPMLADEAIGADEPI